MRTRLVGIASVLSGILASVGLTQSSPPPAGRGLRLSDSPDSAALVARALAIVRADGSFGSLRVTAYQREGDVTTIAFRNPDPDALGGGVVVHINLRNGQVCLEVYG